MSKKGNLIRQTNYPHIVKIDGVCGGEAVIEGTRIAVWHIVGYYYKVGMPVEDILKVGMPVEDILAEWSYLTPAQIFSALAYYHDNKRKIDAARDQNSYESWKKQHTDAAA